MRFLDLSEIEGMEQVFGRTAIMLMVLLLSLAPSLSQAADVPQAFTLDGYLYSDTAGTTTLNDSSIVFRIQILDEAKTCILYEETQTTSTLVTKGHFSISVGSEVGAGKRSSNDSANSMPTVFQNIGNITGKLVSNGAACTVTASGGKKRYIRTFITPSTMLAGGERTLSPDINLDSVPNAIVAERAETLQGSRAADFLKVNTAAGSVLSQTNLENLFSSNTRFTAISDLASGTSTAYIRSTAALGAPLPTFAGAPSSPATGSLWYDTTAGKLTYQSAGGPVAVGAGGGSGDITNGGNTTGAAVTVGTNDNFALNLETNGTTKMTVLGNGNVGIGTTTPTAPLEVIGNLEVGGSNTTTGTQSLAAGFNNTASATNTIALGDSNIASGTRSFAAGSFNTASGAYSTAMGASSVASGNTAFARGTNATASGDYSTANGFYSTAESYMQTTLGAYNMPKGSETAGSWVATDPLFSLGNGTGAGASRSTALMVLKNGNVGIGTTAPSGKLEVSGDSGTASITSNVAHATQYPTFSGVRSRGTQASKTNVGNNDILTMFTGSGWYGASNVQGATINFEVDGSPGANDMPGRLTFLTTPDGGFLPAERMRIDNAGNVGIGTTAPATALDLNGAWSIRGMAAPAVSVAGQGRIYFDSTANKFKVSENNGAYVDLVGGGGGLSTTLADGKIYVGNGSNVATAVTPSGDVSMVNDGTFAVNKIKGVSVSAAAPNDGQVLKYVSGTTSWTPSNFSIGDLKTAAGAQQFAGSTACTAKQTSTWSSLTDTFTCTDIAGLDGGAITTGTVAAARLPSSASAWTVSGSDIYRATGNVAIGTTTPGTNILNVDGGSTGSKGVLIKASDDPMGASPGSISITAGYAMSTGGSINLTTGYNDAGGGYVGAVNILSGGVISEVRLDGSAGIADGLNLYRGNASPGINSGIAMSFSARDAAGTKRTLADVSTIMTDTAAGTLKSDILINSVHNGTLAEKMRITSSGNLGIGTNAPAAKLEVAGNINVGSQTTRGTATTNRGQLALASSYTQAINANASVDWNNGNMQEISTFVCDGTKTITFTNVKDGAAYSLLISGNGNHTSTCLFSAAGKVFKTSGVAVGPTPNFDVVFTFAVFGSTIVYNMVDNLQ